MNTYLTGLSRLILIAVFCIFCGKITFSQTNPLYADKFGQPVYEHWMFTGYDDSVTGTWNNLSPLQQALYGVNAFYWEGNGKVFICGGSTQQNVPQSSCWWYDPAGDTYSPAASLPHGRWSGKLLRVKDSLYLIGSIDSTFISADGFVFKYSLTENTWTQKTTMPAPYVHESASTVVNDSTIIVIGGSTNAFLNPINIVRVYNPLKDSWRSLSGTSVFPVNNTSAHAECLRPDTVNYIFVLGGYGSGALNTVFKGTVSYGFSDSISISWTLFDTLNAGLFGQPIYRVAGAKWNNTALFGPGLNGASTVNSIWGLTLYGDTDHVWTKFEPGSPDSSANISSFAVKSGADTNYFFMFGGFKNPNIVSSAGRYTFATPPPPPIGINNNSGNVPDKFMLWQNYPNPFNPETKIKFSVPAGENRQIKLTVYDITGKEVSTLVNEVLRTGLYEASFNGIKLSSGVYFYTLISGESRLTKAMVLVK